MRKWLHTLLAAGLWAGLSMQCASASDHCRRPACEPGYTIVEEIVYKDVVKHRCVPAPGVQKKTHWVYEQVPDPFCVKKCALGHGHNCGTCTQCSCVHNRNLLVKRLVVEECPADKCVIETYVEKVACKVYRKVPCGAAPTMPPAAGAVPAAPLHCPPPCATPTKPMMPPAGAAFPTNPTIPAAIAPSIPAGVVAPSAAAAATPPPLPTAPPVTITPLP